MQVLLDTNFLLVPVQFRVDVFAQLREKGYNDFFTMSACIEELRKLGKQKKHEKNVNVALDLVRKNRVKVIETSLGADASIIDYANDYNNIAVATLDKALIKALKAAGIKVIRLRQKKYLIQA